jgi:hypothetical protein
VFVRAACCQKVFNVKKLVDSVKKSHFGFAGTAQRPLRRSPARQRRRKREAISKVVS